MDNVQKAKELAPPEQSREAIREEIRDLTARLERLNDFMELDEFLKQDPEDQELMKTQRQGMREYATALARRQMRLSLRRLGLLDGLQ